MIGGLAKPMRRRLLETHDPSTFETRMPISRRGVKSDYTRDFSNRKRLEQKTGMGKRTDNVPGSWPIRASPSARPFALQEAFHPPTIPRLWEAQAWRLAVAHEAGSGRGLIFPLFAGPPGLRRLPISSAGVDCGPLSLRHFHLRRQYSAPVSHGAK